MYRITFRFFQRILQTDLLKPFLRGLWPYSHCLFVRDKSGLAFTLGSHLLQD